MQFELTHAIAILGRTPATFRSLLDGLEEEWIHADEGPATFSAFDNIGHLVHGERTNWIPRASIILDQRNGRPFGPFDRLRTMRRAGGRE